MLFVFLHVAWIGFRVERYPFGLLTMIVSLEAIFLSTFVMIRPCTRWPRLGAGQPVRTGRRRAVVASAAQTRSGGNGPEKGSR